MSAPFPPLVHPMVRLSQPTPGVATPQWTQYFNAVARQGEIVSELSAGTLLGRGTGADGEAESITLGDGLTLTGTVLSAPSASVTPFDNVGLTVRDLSGFFALTLRPLDSLTADRTLNVVTGDADRTLTLTGDPTLANWFDQSVKTSASPAFTGLSVNGHAFTVGGAPTLNDWFNQNVKTTASPTFNQVNATMVDSVAYEVGGTPGVNGDFTLMVDGGGTVRLVSTNGLVVIYA